MAVRLNVGTDYKNYTNIFNYARTHGWDLYNYPTFANLEKGFMLLVKVFATIFGNEGVWGTLALIFVGFSISAINLHIYEKKFSMTIAYVYFFVFFYVYSFNGFRQVLAFGICLYAMKYIFENDKRYFLYILLAIFIHFSAIVAMSFWFMWNHENNRMITKKTQNIILGISLLVALGYKVLLRFILSISFFSFMQKYNYILSETSGGNRTFIFYVLITLVVMFFSKYLKKINIQNELYVFLIYMNLIVGIASLSNRILYRLNIYFQMGFVLLLPYIPGCVDRKSRIVVKTAMIIVAAMYFVLVYYVVGNGDIFPYKFVWQGV